MTISEKVAYLKGLAEGLGLDTEKSKEGKLISVMIGILEEVGLSLEDLEENTTVLGEELDAISDDLSDVEKVIYGDDDDDEDEDDDCDCCCDEDDEEDDDFFQVECPNCGEDLTIDHDVLEAGTIECPACKSQFAIAFADECGCEDDHCDCGCHDHDED